MPLMMAECGPPTLTTTGPRRVEPSARRTPDARPPLLQDLNHLGVEPELTPARLARPLHVVAGQRGIVDVARLGDVDRAADVPAGGRAETVVLQGDGRTERARVDPGESGRDLLDRQVLVGDMKLVEGGHHVHEVVVAVVFHHQTPRVHVLRQPHFVGLAQVATPVEPVEVALAGHGAAVWGGVVQPDDRAGVAGGAAPGGGLLVEVEGAVAALRQLEAGADADDAGADDDRVVVVGHDRTGRRVMFRRPGQRCPWR